MNAKQMEHGENTRWAVREIYFGVFDSERILCGCFDIQAAAQIVDALVKFHKGRTYQYVVEKVADDYDEVRDEVVYYDPLMEKTYDYNKYLKGVSCLDNSDQEE